MERSIEQPEILSDRRSLESAEGKDKRKVDILLPEIKRALVRFIESIEESKAQMSKTRDNSAFDPKKFEDRLVESTYHPSHNLPPRFYLALVKARHELWQKYSSFSEGEVMQKKEVEQDAEKYALQIYAESAYSARNLADSFIPSNANLNAQEIDFLQKEVVHSLETDPNKEPDERIVELSNRIRSSTGEFDESKETLIEAKILLLNGISEYHHVWVDFDGSKRAQGHAFSKYAALVHEDIAQNYSFLDPKEQQETESLYNDFQKNASLNHAITILLKEEKHPKNTLRELEKIMSELKIEREKILTKLIQIKNLIKKKRFDINKKDFIYISDRVKFLPRLDHKLVEAASGKQQEEMTSEFGEIEEKKEPYNKGQYRMLSNILDQVLEMNKLVQENDYYDFASGHALPLDDGIATREKQAVPQIMIAMAQGPDDLITMLKEVADARHRKAILDPSSSYNTPIPIVLLFEQEDVMGSTKIKNCLGKVLNFYKSNYGLEFGIELFKKEVIEIFIAGSDLSKEVGQTSALIMAHNTAKAIYEFNQGNNTNIKLKLGSGEAPFRQGGRWDTEGYLDLFKGKILDYKELDEESAREKYGENWEEMIIKEKTEIKDDVDFLTRLYGENWKNAKRKPRGFNWLFKKFPLINSYTNQSYSKEGSVWNIDISRLRKMIQQALADHSRENKEDFLELPTSLTEAAQAEKAFYQKIVGKKGDVEKPMFGRMLELDAKDFPMPIIRDRAISRSESGQDEIEKLDKLAKVGIDARAISVNTVSGFMFPLYLLGKGSMLEQAKSNSKLEEVLEYVDVKAVLREMKLFGTIANDVFGIIKASGLNDVAIELEGEWNRLLDFRKDLQKKLWQEESTEEVDFLRKDITDADRQRIARLLVPGTRELLIDDFETGFASDRTNLFKVNFTENKEFLEITTEYVKTGYDFRDIFNKKIKEEKLDKDVVLKQLQNNALHDNADMELVKKYNAFKKVSEKIQKIDPKKYGEFIGDLAYASSPGM